MLLIPSIAITTVTISKKPQCEYDNENQTLYIDLLTTKKHIYAHILGNGLPLQTIPVVYSNMEHHKAPFSATACLYGVRLKLGLITPSYVISEHDSPVALSYIN
jgi:hypothetical protein